MLATMEGRYPHLDRSGEGRASLPHHHGPYGTQVNVEDDGKGGPTIAFASEPGLWHGHVPSGGFPNGERFSSD